MFVALLIHAKKGYYETLRFSLLRLLNVLLPAKQAMSLLEPGVELCNIFVFMYQFRDVLSSFH